MYKKVSRVFCSTAIPDKKEDRITNKRAQMLEKKEVLADKVVRLLFNNYLDNRDRIKGLVKEALVKKSNEELKALIDE